MAQKRVKVELIDIEEMTPWAFKEVISLQKEGYNIVGIEYILEKKDSDELVVSSAPEAVLPAEEDDDVLALDFFDDEKDKRETSGSGDLDLSLG